MWIEDRYPIDAMRLRTHLMNTISIIVLVMIVLLFILALALMLMA